MSEVATVTESANYFVFAKDEIREGKKIGFYVTISTAVSSDQGNWEADEFVTSRIPFLNERVDRVDAAIAYAIVSHFGTHFKTAEVVSSHSWVVTVENNSDSDSE